MALTVNKTIEKTYINPTDATDTIKNSVNYPNAYVFVAAVSGKEELTAYVKTFATADKKNLVELSQYTFRAEMIDKNFIQQAYEYLKTLPEFGGAEDC